MKKFVFIAFLFIGNLSYSQTDKWEFTEVVQVDSAITKDLLYNAARDWFAITFKSSKSVLEIEDKEQGKLFGKGKFQMNKKVHGYVDFTILIQVKAGRYKYTLSDFVQTDAIGSNSFHGVPPNGGTHFDMGSLNQDKPDVNAWVTLCGSKCWKDIKEQTTKELIVLVQSLKDRMSKASIEQNENW